MSLQTTAQKLAAQGRNGDSMLVHMSPNEVGGLQALAMAHGGSLSINPKTGLPEAFFLAALVPTLLGALAPTLGAAATGAGLTGLGTFLGSKMGAIGLGALAGGLMNKENPLMGAISGGFGGYGGAGIGNALTSAGAAAPGSVAANLGVQGAATGAGSQAAQLAAQNAGFGQAGLEATRQAAATATGATMAPTLSNLQLAGNSLSNLGTAQGWSNLGAELNTALPSTTAKIAAASPFLAALSTPSSLKFPNKKEESNYAGPYLPTARDVFFPDEDRRASSEFTYFSPSNPVPFQYGGSVPQLEDGGFVLTKKAVDGIGNGDNTQGQTAAAMGLGAIPIKGPGHGTSDSIKTSIDNKVPALVSNGEAYVPRRNVQKAGGAKQLYALMRKAERRA
jgi:hypothetical protein